MFLTLNHIYPNKKNEGQRTRRNNDASKFEVPYQRSNLGTSPQISPERVSKSSLETKKNQDFQYRNDEGKSLTILASFILGTNS